MPVGAPELRGLLMCVLPLAAGLLAACDGYPTPRAANRCARSVECLTEGRCQPNDPGVSPPYIPRVSNDPTAPNRKKVIGRRKGSRKAMTKKGLPKTNVGLEGAPKQKKVPPKRKGVVASGPSSSSDDTVTVDLNCNINGLKCESPEEEEDDEVPYCVASRDGDCRRSLWACRLDGRCEAENGRCVAGSDAQCEQSYRCRRNGWCTAEDGRCVAGSDADCEDSQICDVYGHCVEVDGACTLPKSDRRSLVERFVRGYRKIVPERVGGGAHPKGALGAMHAERRSIPRVCKGSGYGGGLGQLHGNPSSSDQSEGDDTDGKSGDAENSDADEERDWKQSDRPIYTGPSLESLPPVERSLADDLDFGGIMSALGRSGSERSKPCRKSPICKRVGRCTERSGTCVATTDEECQQSEACERRGWCTSEECRCVALFDADCRGSAVCEKFDRCRARDGVCVVRNEESCSNSEACREEGRCSAPRRLRGDRCVVEDDSDCRGSTVCEEEGKCVAYGGQCVRPLAKADGVCRGTAFCRKWGACHELEHKSGEAPMRVCRLTSRLLGFGLQEYEIETLSPFLRHVSDISDVEWYEDVQDPLDETERLFVCRERKQKLAADWSCLP